MKIPERMLVDLVEQILAACDGAEKPHEYLGDEAQVIIGSDAFKTALRWHKRRAAKKEPPDGR